jgi:hypothetical protein
MRILTGKFEATERFETVMSDKNYTLRFPTNHGPITFNVTIMDGRSASLTASLVAVPNYVLHLLRQPAMLQILTIEIDLLCMKKRKKRVQPLPNRRRNQERNQLQAKKMMMKHW